MGALAVVNHWYKLRGVSSFLRVVAVHKGGDVLCFTPKGAAVNLSAAAAWK